MQYTTPVIPQSVVLETNAPNPFNPVTTIRFGLPQAGKVRLTIYSVTGKKVATLVNDYLEAGYHEVAWAGTNSAGQPVASGIYIYELVAGDKRLVRKMLLAK